MVNSLRTLTLTLRDGNSFAEFDALVARVDSVTQRRNEAPLGLSPTVVGSGPEASLRIDDASVSRVHCELSLVEDGVLVVDRGSRNGTFCAGVRIREAMVSPLARLQLGGSEVSFFDPESRTRIPLSNEAAFGPVVGSSVVMRALFATLERLASSTQSVVFVGESGTGKDALAKALHDRGPMASGPWVVLDVSALNEQLMEAEVFGHEVGAFTDAKTARAGAFERAHGGTLFIDDLASLAPSLQPKLLRVVETGEVCRLGDPRPRPARPRLLVASREPLEALEARGALRPDLRHRLAGIEVRVPPLRERRDDIPLLVDTFLRGLDPPRALADLPPHAMGLLQAHQWPGNARELRNVLQRLTLLPHVGDKALQDLFSKSSAPKLGSAHRLPLKEARDLVVSEFERSYLAQHLKAHGGNISQTARAIGMSRQMLYQLLERHGLRG